MVQPQVDSSPVLMLKQKPAFISRTITASLSNLEIQILRNEQVHEPGFDYLSDSETRSQGPFYDLPFRPPVSCPRGWR